MGAERVIAGRVLGWGPRLVVVAVLVTVLAYARPDGFLEYDLDPSGEGNLFAWASTVATFAAAFASLLLAFARPERRVRFVVLAACFAFLSFDDMRMAHERLGSELFAGALGLPTNVSEQLEVLLYAPLFGVAIWIVWTLSRETYRQAAVTLLGGLAFLGLAVACEFGGIVTRRLTESGVPYVNQVRIAVEEVSELSGWILVAVGLTALACEAIADAERIASSSPPSSTQPRVGTDHPATRTGS